MEQDHLDRQIIRNENFESRLENVQLQQQDDLNGPIIPVSPAPLFHCRFEPLEQQDYLDLQLNSDENFENRLEHMPIADLDELIVLD